MTIRKLVATSLLSILIAAWVSFGALPVVLSGAGYSPARAADVESKQIVPFVPTPQPVVDSMLELAQVIHAAVRRRIATVQKAMHEDSLDLVLLGHAQ